MFVRSDRVYYSASDLKAAVECEWALMRKIDAKLGRIEAIEETEDVMLARASLLGGEQSARADPKTLLAAQAQHPGRRRHPSVAFHRRCLFRRCATM
jgi:hypothetical protein